jgi:hypothetical protein
MIDVLDTVLAYLDTCYDLVTLVEGRMAKKHQFAMDEGDDGTVGGWPTPAMALQVGYSTGATADLSTGNSMNRLEARCYGANQTEASQVYNTLISVLPGHRTLVDLPTERALLYWLLPEDAPMFDYDLDLRIDFVRIFLRSNVNRTPV